MPLQVSLRWSNEQPPGRSAQMMERLAETDRRALGLGFGEPCDPRRLVNLYDVSFILESIDDYKSYLACDAGEVAELCGGLDQFSSAAIRVPGCEWLILVNPAHRRHRATLDIAHEFGHLVRGHRPLSVSEFGADMVFPYYSQKQEDEAYGYALALLLPYAPLRQYLASGASHQAIADHHGISLQAMKMRLQLVGLWPSDSRS